VTNLAVKIAIKFSTTNKMLRSSLILTFGLILAGVRAEYVWTGTEWKWNEPGASQQAPDSTLSNGGSLSSSANEGSGDGGDYNDDEYDDDDEYNDDYNYDDNNEDYYDSGRTKNKGSTGILNVDNAHSNTGILPATDDEDMVEGSGTVYNTGSGFSGRDPVTQAPTHTKQDVYVDEDLHDDYNYSEEDYDEHYDDNDIVFEGSDDDYGKNIDVGVTARPTQFAYPATTRKPTTKRPTHIYTDEDTSGVHREKPSGRPASFFAQPGILAAVIGGAVVGLLCAILLVMFIVYRMRKKDEGSYALDEPKRSHNVNSYSKPPSREFYA